ncbi:MAG: hypothetical protein ACPGXL_08350 [Chitinophagales bacterium]
MNNKFEQDANEFGRPPFFKTWRGMYVLVIANLALLITFFYWFTNAYS